MKARLVEKFKNYPRLLELVYTLKEDSNETHKEFLESIQKIDLVRNVKFQDICPDLASLLF
jgi:hypothetical protein